MFCLYVFFYLLGMFWCEKYIAVVYCIITSVVLYKIGYAIIQKKIEEKKYELAKWILFGMLHMVVGYGYILYICYSQFEKRHFIFSSIIVTIILLGTSVYFYRKGVQIKGITYLDKEKYEEKKEDKKKKAEVYASLGALIGISISKTINFLF